MTGDTRHVIHKDFFFFFGIGATIRKRQEIQCLPYAGFKNYYCHQLYKFHERKKSFPENKFNSLNTFLEPFLLRIQDICSFVVDIKPFLACCKVYHATIIFVTFSPGQISHIQNYLPG